MANKLGGWAGLAGLTDSLLGYDTPLKNSNVGLGLLGIMQALGNDKANAMFGGFLPAGAIPDFSKPPGSGGGSGGGTSPPPPPPAPPPAPPPNPGMPTWAFPDYYSDWAFTPPAPFYNPPPPVFNKANYPATPTTPPKK